MVAGSPLQVTLYHKPECPLCDELKADLLAMQPEVGFLLSERNIEDDKELFARFRYLIPVLEIDGAELVYPPHSWSRTYAALTKLRGPGGGATAATQPT